MLLPIGRLNRFSEIRRLRFEVRQSVPLRVGPMTAAPPGG
jgi:hypothetical protein